MLTDDRVEFILGRIPSLTIGVLGDLFLDRYLDIDAALTEPSVETNLDAYQVVKVRSIPGAAGTVINNLVALGVKRVVAISVIGDDGEGYELRRALARLNVVDASRVFAAPGHRTPTYTKPMLEEAGQPPRELNRLDIKNRKPLAGPLQDLVMESVSAVFPDVDALLVMDQVSDEDCGVVTANVRDLLGQMGRACPEKFILADSRERIGLYRCVSLKPNLDECLKAIHGDDYYDRNLDMFAAVARLAERSERAVFCTHGKQGIHLVDHRGKTAPLTTIKAYPVTGPIDIVGAGDSTSAAIGCAVAAGASYEEAAAFGNLVASITIQQIGTTGTATPEQVRKRWKEVSNNS